MFRKITSKRRNLLTTLGVLTLLLVLTVTVVIAAEGGDTLADALRWRGTFQDFDDTSRGADNYDLFPRGCAGSSGSSYNRLSGWGPDLVYALQTSDNCGRNNSALVTLAPNPGVDLALYVFTDPDNLHDTCVGASDTAGRGGEEGVIFNPSNDVDYFIIVDGSNQSAGGFNLTVSCGDEDPTAITLESLTASSGSQSSTFSLWLLPALVAVPLGSTGLWYYRRSKSKHL